MTMQATALSRVVTAFQAVRGTVVATDGGPAPKSGAWAIGIGQNGINRRQRSLRDDWVTAEIEAVLGIGGTRDDSIFLEAAEQFKPVVRGLAGYVPFSLLAQVEAGTGNRRVLVLTWQLRWREARNGN